MTAFLSRLEMPNLSQLALNSLPVGADGARAIAASPSFGRLTHLDLPGAQITDAGFRAMLDSPHLQRLIDVGLSSNRIGKSAAALADRNVWPLLSKCNLNGNEIPRAVAKRLVRARRGLEAD